jgi:hypothetical protein
MKLSEKIGYVLEHLILLDLESRGIPVTRSECVTNESIKSDLVFSSSNIKYVLFVTHSRTQGMTNRKFYRTLEELVERRINEPESLCVEITLRKDPVRTPDQYNMIFEELFDAVVSVFSAQQEMAFVRFVEEYPSKKVSLGQTKAHSSNCSKPVLQAVNVAVDKILQIRKSASAILRNYWLAESNVTRGSLHMNSNSNVSIKLGMKMLSLIPRANELLKEIAKGQLSVVEDLELRKKQWQVPLTLNIINCRLTLNGRGVFKFDRNVLAAAQLCQRLSVNLKSGWESEYLTSEGASELYGAIVDPALMEQKFRESADAIAAADTLEKLKRVFHADYKSGSGRCDKIDMAIRTAGVSQNDMSTILVEEMNLDIKQRNPVWFIVAKDDQAASIFPDVKEAISRLAGLVWERTKSKKTNVTLEEFRSERVRTYFSHRSVVHHLALLSIPGDTLPKSRQSVLPRIIGLPSKYSMYVQSDIQMLGDNDEKLFIKTISTPEARHHKHKEFAGKLRAIRYEWENGQIKVDKKLRFLCVIDGEWTPEQIGLLLASGWTVSDWDGLAFALGSNQNAT